MDSNNACLLRWDDVTIRASPSLYLSLPLVSKCFLFSSFSSFTYCACMHACMNNDRPWHGRKAELNSVCMSYSQYNFLKSTTSALYVYIYIYIKSCLSLSTGPYLFLIPPPRLRSGCKSIQISFSPPLHLPSSHARPPVHLTFPFALPLYLMMIWWTMV